jgi:serine O-acetyltransferase
MKWAMHPNIQNYKDYLFFVKSDKFALGIDDSFSGKVYRCFYPNYIWQFQKSLRKVEYLSNCKDSAFSRVILYFANRNFSRISLKLGFSIPINVFGPGLSIPHYGTIIVNPSANIGCNTRLHAGVTIGANAGNAKSPTIGMNCYIGPGAKIFGDITIADNVVIGANCVVNKSIKESNIAVAGVPARKVKDFFDIEDVVLFATDGVKKGITANPFINTKELNTLIKNK